MGIRAKKAFVLWAVVIFFSQTSFGQLPDGSIAPDFTFVDINGTTQNLYTYLNQGKFVAIDVSATWCGPCWDYHNEHGFDSLYNLHDTPGDQFWKTIFMEADGNTNAADLIGTGTNTQGNWVQGSNFVVIDPPGGIPLNDFKNGYAVNFFPSFYLICPDKRVFDANVTGGRPSVAIWESIAAKCSSTSVSNISGPHDLVTWPVPAYGQLKVLFSLDKAAPITVTIYTFIGERVSVQHIPSGYPGQQTVLCDVSYLRSGMYFLAISTPIGKETVTKFFIR